MTMQDRADDTLPGGQTHWLQDQVGQLKAQFSRIQQQGEQVQAALIDVNEKMRDAEGRLRELGARTIGLPSMQEQLRQMSGLLERIQDAEVLIDTKFELVERTTAEERTRDQGEKNDLYRRVQDLERRTEALHERQASVDDVNRRFQEEVSRSHLQYQGVAQRVEALEGRVGRNTESITRIEQLQSENESAIRGLRREDDVLAERARLAHEVAGRLEVELHTQAEEWRGLPLLAERVELLRAERQRLDDRTSRAEASLDDARVRLERQEEVGAQMEARLKSHDGRIDHVHSTTLEYRRNLTDQVLKLNQTLERMKRRQLEELDRQVKELRLHSNQLKNAEEE